MTYSILDSADMNDVDIEIGEEPSKIDNSGDIDEVLDSLSIEELHDLRDGITNGDLSDVDISSLKPLDEEPVQNYEFHWDGGPTHNTDLDEEAPPEPYTKKLTR